MRDDIMKEQNELESAAPQHGSNDAVTLRQALANQLKHQKLIHTPQVEEAFRTVPRHVFVPHEDIATAYSDRHIVTRWQNELPISSCSQPAITAIMLELLDLQPGQRVLEIGAGTGYAAALMAHIVGESGQVVTIDLDEDIVDDARKHLEAAGINNVQVICADGGLGWNEQAPYDRVILTVGASDIAPAWYEQLRPGGRLVLPLQFTSFQSELAIPSDQLLLALDRTNSCLQSAAITCCAFIPLRGAFAETHTRPVSPGTETGLTCTFSGDANTDDAFTVLSGPYQDEATEARVSFPELGGLRLWLALREPNYCELSVKGNMAKGSMVPPLLRRSDDFIATVGLYRQGTWCLLLLEEVSSTTAESKRPFKLTIRRFGLDHGLVQHMGEQLTIWEKAGRPFTWSPHGTMEDLRIRAYPVGEEVVPQAHETLLKKRWTQFVFSMIDVPG
jgi:protein-L-isoaspartate(D-aspartate) O-methyltransferase